MANLTFLSNLSYETTESYIYAATDILTTTSIPTFQTPNPAPVAENMYADPSPGLPQHPSCLVGNYKCKQNALYICAYTTTTEQSWSLLAQCPVDTQCTTSNSYVGCTPSAMTAKCTFGEYKCLKQTVYQCGYTSSGLDWISLARCSSGTMCVVQNTFVGCVNDIAAPQSLPPPVVCVHGAYKCSGNKILQCSYGGYDTLSYVVIGSCKSGTFCTVNGPNGYVGCVLGFVPVVKCIYGAYKCSGNSIYQCSYGGSGLSWIKISTCKKESKCVVNGPNGYVGCI